MILVLQLEFLVPLWSIMVAMWSLSASDSSSCAFNCGVAVWCRMDHYWEHYEPS
jgi:hypothetical protein